MYINRKKHWLLLLVGCGLLCVLAACGATSSLRTNPLAIQVNNVTSSQGNEGASSTVQTVAVPPTQTSCPASGAARAWVTAPLALGKHANLVYMVNEYNGQKPTFGTLKRYDLATQRKTEIVKLANTSITDAQVSADGQWLLFESNNNSVNKLQAVRMDGQGLQTLYCSSSANMPQWSTNQKLIAFTQVYPNNKSAILLLRTKDGSLEIVFTQPTQTSREYEIRTWLDTTRLYLVRTDTDVPPDELAVLDTSKGANQSANNLITVVSRGGNQMQMDSFDSSYDGSQLFLDRHNCTQACIPPSDITVQPPLGGTEHTILHSTTLSITNVRAVTPNTLLLSVAAFSIGGHTDTSKNGLWAIHTDGSKLTRLTTDSADQIAEINNFSQFPWSNVSRDGTLYAAAQLSNFKAQHPTNTILIGSLSGGTPTTIASIADGTTLAVTGWTTM